MNRRDFKKELLDLLRNGPKSITTVPASYIDAAAELLDEGRIERDQVGRDGRQLYRLADRGQPGRP